MRALRDLNCPYCGKPWRAGHRCEPATACDWCGQKDTDPIKPEDDD